MNHKDDELGCSNTGNSSSSINSHLMNLATSYRSECHLTIESLGKQKPLDFETQLKVDFEIKEEPYDPFFIGCPTFKPSFSLSNSSLPFDDNSQPPEIPSVKNEEDSPECACDGPTTRIDALTHSTTLFPSVTETDRVTENEEDSPECACDGPTTRIDALTHSTTLFPSVTETDRVTEVCTLKPCFVLLEQVTVMPSSNFEGETNDLFPNREKSGPERNDSPNKIALSNSVNVAKHAFMRDSCARTRSFNPVKYDGMNLYSREFCEKSHNEKKSFTSHEHIRHSTRPEDEIPHTCDYCKRAFTTKDSVKRHIYRSCHLLEYKYKSKFICDYCEKRYRSKQYLQVHILKAHIPNSHQILKSYCRFRTCEICQRGFTDASNLNRHKRKVHGKLPKFYREPLLTVDPVCEVCGRSFSTTWSKKVHVQRHCSNDPRPKNVRNVMSKHRFLQNQKLLALNMPLHKCKICGALFKEKFHLNRHVLIHSGVKHKCNQCDQEFSDRDGLNRHLRRVHQKTEPLKKI